MRHLPYMVGVFFCCHNITMDVLKLCEKVLESEEVKDIPLMYVYIIVTCVIEAIGSGECFYPTE